jgi:uncharacterized Tic20 family protein
MAAAAHGSILFLGWGVIVPVIIWLTNRSKSAFVSFHALQAIVYQLSQTILMTLLSFAAGLIMMVVMFGTMFQSAGNEEMMSLVMIAGQFLAMSVIMLGFGLFILYGFIGAALILSKREFWYLLFGGWIYRFLQSDPQVEPTPQAMVSE